MYKKLYELWRQNANASRLGTAAVGPYIDIDKTENTSYIPEPFRF